MSPPRERLYTVAAILALVGWVGFQFFDDDSPSGRAAVRIQADEGGRMRSSEFGELKDFDRILVTGPDTVMVTLGGEFSVRARGEDDAVGALTMTVVDRELRIGRSDWQGGESRRKGRDVLINVTMPAIRGASVTGSGDLRIDRATGDSLAVSLDGSGDLRIGAVQVQRLDMAARGSGDMWLSGQVASARLTQSGSGDVRADGLKAQSADLSVAGSGDVGLGSDGKASVSVTGTGDVRIRGNAQCSISRSGTGDVECG